MTSKLFRRIFLAMGRERIQRTRDEIAPGDWPTWWNTHGFQMGVRELDTKRHKLVIKGTAASLTISPSEYGNWYLDWEIKHSIETQVNGRIQLDKEGIEAAFRLSNSKGRWGGVDLAKRFGADSAEYGHYIRKEEYLNIPGPGIGFIGDPNISIHLDEDVKGAVADLLGTRG